MKNPFTIVEEFLSPIEAEDMVFDVEFDTPNVDHEDRVQVTFKTCELVEKQLADMVVDLVPSLEEYYGFEYAGMTRPIFEWLNPSTHIPTHAENSEFMDGKWVMTKQRALTGVLFLSDAVDGHALDPEYEVFGGKLEFMNHNFGFMPQRGTLVLFPSGPHFLNATSHVKMGNLYQVRFHLVSQDPFVYQPANFPGNYTTWFA